MLSQKSLDKLTAQIIESYGSDEIPEIISIDFKRFHWQNPDLLDSEFAEEDLVEIEKKLNQKESALLMIYSPAFKKGEMTLEGIDSWLDTLLFEDVWCPDGEQFCFTRLGKALDKAWDRKFHANKDLGNSFALSLFLMSRSIK